MACQEGDYVAGVVAGSTFSTSGLEILSQKKQTHGQINVTGIFAKTTGTTFTISASGSYMGGYGVLLRKP